MSAEVYYRKEAERHNRALKSKLTEDQVLTAVYLLCEKYDIPVIPLATRPRKKKNPNGKVVSYFSFSTRHGVKRYSIYLHPEMMHLLGACHEVAHYVMAHSYHRKCQSIMSSKTSTLADLPRQPIWHGKAHAKLVDDCVEYLNVMMAVRPYPKSSLEREFAWL